MILDQFHPPPNLITYPKIQINILLLLGPTSVCFPRGFSINILHAFLDIQSTCPAYRSTNLTIPGDLYKLQSSSLRNILHFSILLSFLGLNVFLRTSFSNTCNFMFPVQIGDHVSHPYKTSCKIIRYFGKQTGRQKQFSN